MLKNIAIFASGNGSNAQRLSEYFASNNNINISLILTNNPKAGVLERAKNLGVKSVVFTRTDFCKGGKVDELLSEQKIDFIILAGFLLLVPDFLIEKYTKKIVNIHPALLPKYGGKGMYGMNVHHSVINSGDKQSGISIHYVNQKYDEGQIIFQARVDIEDGETAESLAGKIHELEYEHFPKVLEKVISNI